MNQNDDVKICETTSDQTDSSANNLDPRIGMRLEDLNKWTGKINALEKSFEEANSNFRLILSESTDRLKGLALKLGKSVEESRPYYAAKEKLISVRGKCQRAAINYEKACQAYLTAKEHIHLAEKKFLSSSSDEFDATWQEKLNQANIKLMEAETMKKESERLHQLSMKDFHSAESVVVNLERKLKGALIKSKIYFDEKRRFQERLALVKEEIELTISQINCSKARYASTLRELEAISEEIHEKRALSLLKHLKREPGDGAEFNPGLISLDSCDININSQLAKLDLQINETLNCQHPTTIEPSQSPTISTSSSSISTSTSTVTTATINSTIKTGQSDDDHSSSQASTSNAITTDNGPSTDSNHSQFLTSDKQDIKHDEKESILSDVNIRDDDDNKVSPDVISLTDEPEDEMNDLKVIGKKSVDKEEEEEDDHDNGDDAIEEEDEDSYDSDQDEYLDVVDEIKTTSSSSSGETNCDQLNGPKVVNGSLSN